MEKKVQVELSWNTLWQVLIFIGIILLFYLARQALGVLFIAIILSLGIDPAVGFLEKRGINRLLGTTIVFFVGFLAISTAIYLIIPIIVVEGQSFLTQFNDTVSTFFGLGIPENIVQQLSSGLNDILGFITSSNISITGTISAVITKSVLVLSTIIVSFYLSVEKRGTERLLRVILPRVYESPVLKVFARFKEKIRVWLIAQIGLSLIVGAVVSTGLWLLDMRYALLLGLIAALLEIVPVIGPIISGIVAFLIALSESFTLGIYVLIFFFIVQQLENNVLIPLVMKRAMRIHPVIVLIALIAGGQAAGFVGILLAVPVALLAQETFNYIAERKNHQSEASLGI